jgi:hypothetical protein
MCATDITGTELFWQPWARSADLVTALAGAGNALAADGAMPPYSGGEVR